MANRAQGRYGWHEAQATASTRSGCTANRAVASPAPREHVHGLFREIESGRHRTSRSRSTHTGRPRWRREGAGWSGGNHEGRVSRWHTAPRRATRPGVGKRRPRTYVQAHFIWAMSQTTVIGIVEEVLIVVPLDEAVFQGGDEGGDDDQGERNRDQPGSPVPNRQRFPTPAGLLIRDRSRGRLRVLWALLPGLPH